MSWYEEGKKPLFEVPEGYFEELPQRIQKRIEASKRRPAWYVSIVHALKQPQWAVSVSVAMLAALVFWFSPRAPKHERLIEHVGDEVLMEYLSHALPSSHLIEELPEDEWKEIMDALELEAETWKQEDKLPAETQEKSSFDSLEKSSTRQL
jgi:hypothetical protein